MGEGWCIVKYILWCASEVKKSPHRPLPRMWSAENCTIISVLIRAYPFPIRPCPSRALRRFSHTKDAR